jgi:NAD(P)-dependent dehydrogenase (short-subunit alcohol dehydrogenase family)
VAHQISAIARSNMHVKYGASKAAVLGISRTDACAYGKDGIRVNSVCPGYIRTPRMLNILRDDYETNDESIGPSNKDRYLPGRNDQIDSS